MHSGPLVGAQGAAGAGGRSNQAHRAPQTGGTFLMNKLHLLPKSWLIQ